MGKEQIKSKERVTEHGEVFTNEREVNAMLDLVKDETERIESRFLGPACGDGNFLIEILRRKLAVVKRQYGRSRSDYEKYSILALSSIYGVDILEDNASRRDSSFANTQRLKRGRNAFNMGASIRAKMKDKILLILKIVGIIVSFPFVALFWLASVLVNSVIRRRDKALVEKPLGLYVDVDGHRMSVLVKGQRKVFQF